MLKAVTFGSGHPESPPLHGRAFRTAPDISLTACLRRTFSRRFLSGFSISGAIRYNVASYRSRAANAALGPNGLPLFPDDSARFGAFSGRIGAVVNSAMVSICLKYARGFRAPNTTDLGILGLVGTGFEVDAGTAASTRRIRWHNRGRRCRARPAFQSRGLGPETNR